MVSFSQKKKKKMFNECDLFKKHSTGIVSFGKKIQEKLICCPSTSYIKAEASIETSLLGHNELGDAGNFCNSTAPR